MKTTTAAFRRIVWAHYRKQGRHTLPWRKTQDPYKILVSEIMLHQTQVDRVLPYYEAFIKRFPTAKMLATAPLSEVLTIWQGLGYNRRARMLRDAARELAARSITDIAEFEKLPGVGPYTARAVAAFAHNKNVVFIETNIRTAVIHHFFPRKKKVSDKEIAKILTTALPKGRSREWYSALMDYGSYLKRSGIKLNEKVSHVRKQKPFKGSKREARGAILRELSKRSASPSELIELLGADRRAQMREALHALWKERLIEKKGQLYTLAA